MKSYLFVVPTIFRAGSVLRTDVFKDLKATGAKIIIVSPFWNDESFKKEFADVEHAPMETLNLPLVRRIARLRDILLAIDKPYFIRSRIIERSIVSHRRVTSLSKKENFLRVVGIIARPFRFIVFPFFDFVEASLLPPRAYRSLVEKYKPSAIILGTASEPQDIVWLALSRIYRIPSFVIDIPWSYFETRFYAIPRTAHYIMWNDKMRDLFLSLYPFPKKLLHVTGCQRYDFYKKRFPTQSREEFFASFGADPKKRLLTFFTLSDYAHPHQGEVTGVLLKAIEDGRLPNDTQVLVRLGWKQKIHDGYKPVLENPNLIIQKADETPHQDYPAHLIYYSDVNLTVGSSLTLDAAVQNKETIFTGFSGEAPHPDDAGIAATYEYEFYKDALDSGGAKVAYDAKKFIELVSEYMRNPEKDSDKRQKLVEAYLGTVDGNAGHRIAEVISASS